MHDNLTNERLSNLFLAEIQIKHCILFNNKRYLLATKVNCNMALATEFVCYSNVL